MYIMAQPEALARDLDVEGLRELAFAMGERGLAKGLSECGWRDEVVGARRAGKGGHDARKVELDGTGVPAALPHAEDALGLKVVLGKGDPRGVPAREPEVLDGGFIDRKERRRGAVFGCHVGDAGSLRGRERRYALTCHLDEAADDISLP